jgi:hypothetical protein
MSLRILEAQHPIAYLTDVLDRIDGVDDADLRELLPDRWEAASDGGAAFRFRRRVARSGRRARRYARAGPSPHEYVGVDRPDKSLIAAI